MGGRKNEMFIIRLLCQIAASLDTWRSLGNAAIAEPASRVFAAPHCDAFGSLGCQIQISQGDA